MFSSLRPARWIPVLVLGVFACKSEPAAPPAAPPTQPVPNAPTPTPAVSGLSEAQLARLGRDVHYGLYLMGRKVGHARVWDRLARDGEPGHFAVGFEMSMSVAGGGNSNQLEANELRFYAEAAPHALVETRFNNSARGFRDERRAVPATADGKPVLRITRSVDGGPEQVRDVVPTEDTLVQQLAVAPNTLDGLEVGRVVEGRVFNWELEADEVVAVTVESLGKRMVAGLEDRIATLAVHYRSSGVRGKSVLASDGSMIELTLGPGLVMKLEEAEIAKSGVTGMDILGISMPSPTKLGSPHKVSRLELTLTGPPTATLQSSPNQRVETTVADGVATHRIVLVRGPGAEVVESELADALGSDATIDTTHEAIVAKAKVLAEGLTTPREKVEAISAWVYLALDKKLATHLPTASMILEKLVGDCTEHTWLTIALLRSLGIPARPVYGVGYTGDEEGVFAYHAWVEVALDGRWEMIDPTWNQKSADATHLRFGSSLGEVAAAIGGFTVESARVVDP